MSWEGTETGLARVLTDRLALPTPTPIQSVCVASLASPHTDYLLRAPTGSGKTLALFAPLLSHILRHHTARTTGTHLLYLCPTRELACQTHTLLMSILQRLKPHWMTGMVLTGGDPGQAGNNRKREKEALRRGQTVVIGTPGRVLDHLEKTTGWIRGQLEWMVLDEADRLLDAGFGPKVNAIIERCRNGNADPGIVYCSATVSDRKNTFVKLKPDSVLITCTSVAEQQTEMPAGLLQEAVVVGAKRRLAALLSILKANQRGKCVVFLSNCDSVDYHYCLFSKRMIPDSPKLSVFKLHGSLTQTERREMLSGFAKEERAVLFATDVAARGLNMGGDTSSVQVIVQYDAPADRLDYVHRAGRTARGAAMTGKSILVLNESERDYLALLKDKHGINIQLADLASLLSWLDSKTGDDRKSRFGLWLKKLTETIGKDAELSELGKRAYASSIRAYATHPHDERHIFHIKRLHLGHLASAFGLDEAKAPTVLERPKPGKRSAEGERIKKPPRKLAQRERASEFAAY